MKVSSSTIMPASSFRHLTVMVVFMSLLTGLCGFGLAAIGSVLKDWTTQIENVMTVDLPAYDESTQIVLSEDELSFKTEQIIQALNNDPTVMSIERYEPSEDTLLEERFDIPNPAFLKIMLHTDRAQNTSDRLTAIITRIAPEAVIQTPDQWSKDVHDTAKLFATVLGGLAACILLVTIVVISGIVRSQLAANKDTIALIHLTGASSYVITRIFQNATAKAVLKGCVFSGLVLACLAKPLADLTDYAGSMSLLYVGIPFIALIFLCLTLIVTYYTVFMNLRDMP